MKAILIQSSTSTLSTDWRVRTDPGDNEEIQKGAILDMPLILRTWCDAPMLWIVDMITNINKHPSHPDFDFELFVHSQADCTSGGGWWFQEEEEWNGMVCCHYCTWLRWAVKQVKESGESINQCIFHRRKQPMEWNGMEGSDTSADIVWFCDYSTVRLQGINIRMITWSKPERLRFNICWWKPVQNHV